MPDYYFIDLITDNKNDYIVSFGMINTTDSLYISGIKKRIDLKEVLSENKELNFRHLFDKTN